MLRTIGPLQNMALNSLRGANNVLDSNPAHVKAREEVHSRSILIPEKSNTLGIESDSILRDLWLFRTGKTGRTLVRLPLSSRLY
jgi:hypothetical protein